MIVTESAVLATTGMLIGILIGAMVVGYYLVNGFTYPGMDEMAAKFNLPARMYPRISLLSLLLGPLLVFLGALLAGGQAVFLLLATNSLGPGWPILLALILLVIVAGVLYLVNYILKILPPYARLAQDGIETVKMQVEKGADISSKPVIQIKSFLAVVNAIFRRNQ